jgi:hypothetical protein
MLSQQKGRMLLERGAPGEEYEAGTVLDNNDAEDGSCVGSLACDNLSDAPPWGKAERDASTPQLVLEFSSGHYDPEQMGNGSEHEQLPIGTVFNNRYQITDMIGRGTYGAAWAAIDLRTLCKEVQHDLRMCTHACRLEQLQIWHACATAWCKAVHSMAWIPACTVWSDGHHESDVLLHCHAGGD